MNMLRSTAGVLSCLLLLRLLYKERRQVNQIFSSMCADWNTFVIVPAKTR